MRTSKTATWTMKDGTKINISKMKDTHLVNAIRMLERAAKINQQVIELSPPNFNGDMVQFYTERDYDYLMGLDDYDLTNEFFEIDYHNLTMEAFERGIDWNFRIGFKKK